MPERDDGEEGEGVRSVLSSHHRRRHCWLKLPPKSSERGNSQKEVKMRRARRWEREVMVVGGHRNATAVIRVTIEPLLEAVLRCFYLPKNDTVVAGCYRRNLCL
ncbi:uncharacterized protein DS421_4g126340 [Arachis hypogaea]|nr:uncharacterized protein DS421_4g126340 [Arachis hypogaea]